MFIYFKLLYNCYDYTLKCIYYYIIAIDSDSLVYYYYSMNIILYYIISDWVGLIGTSDLIA